MELHGFISFLSTQKPTDEDVQCYHDGTLQSVELTENIPYEPYSARFTESEKAALAAPSVSAVHITIPRPKVSDNRPNKEEEEVYHRFQHPPILDKRELAVASRLDVSNSPIELADKDKLVTRIVAAVNVRSDSEMEGGSPLPCEECADKKGCCCAAKIATKDQGSVITKEILAKHWWVPDVVKKRNQIIVKEKSKYWQQTHKYGIRIPKTVQEALAIDKENDNTLWWDVICKEMWNVRPAFEKWEQKECELPPA